ncbi:urease accessory protein [Terracoccus luteus]|uniref:Urease accessory protein UreF n=1 Tax=Terracoccus luteus TaxID=53356 RepID=A0A495XWD4_9MICO|nr:urease accessory UreF family protein [Terracoccus luteus]RKT76773.1 urease accessory protein [Terracoccus luteus]
MSSPELVLAMLADARLPTGSHAHSAGLEPAVLAGLTADGRRLHEVPAYAKTRLATVTRTEAAAAVVARHRWLDGDRDLEPVTDAWCARTPSAAIRQASFALGRGYLRLATGLWPKEIGAHVDRRTPLPRPVVLGVVGAVTGLDARQVACLAGYDDVQSIVSAALKLVPLDPTEGMRWVLALHPAIDAMADEVAPLTRPEDIPAQGAPMIDAHAEAHATTTRRLFSA